VSSPAKPIPGCKNTRMELGKTNHYREASFPVLIARGDLVLKTKVLFYRVSALVAVVLCCAQSANADFVINDDLIVDGSACVGFDCVNGENFGFDTIKLKENNVRIKFDDTSTTGSFPKRDWQLLANESSNGGLERFSIEDVTAGRIPFTIEGNAPSNSLYVDDGGRIGLGTSTPVVNLHIKHGNTPTLRLEQDGSSGFTPQTWDVAGNETNFFVRDATNGSRLPFKVFPSSPTNALVLDDANGGSIGMGTQSPDSSLHILRTSSLAQLHVEDNNNGTGARVLIEDDGSGGANKPGFVLRSGSAASSGDWVFEVDGAGNFQIDFSPSAGPELAITDSTTTNGSTINLNGDVNIAGSLSKGGGSFKIDHPLDPANKYLYHSFVESPDMMNIYNGNSVLNEEGVSVIHMPDWFDALNREFRYQLTAIGSAAPELHIAEPLDGNQFKIAGGKPGMRVSWQVTGVRKDPFAEQNRIPVEQVKPSTERGRYLHPKAYGQPPEKAISAAPKGVALAN